MSAIQKQLTSAGAASTNTRPSRKALLYHPLRIGAILLLAIFLPCASPAAFAQTILRPVPLSSTTWFNAIESHSFNSGNKADVSNGQITGVAKPSPKRRKTTG